MHGRPQMLEDGIHSIYPSIYACSSSAEYNSSVDAFILPYKHMHALYQTCLYLNCTAHMHENVNVYWHAFAQKSLLQENYVTALFLHSSMQATRLTMTTQRRCIVLYKLYFIVQPLFAVTLIDKAWLLTKARTEKYARINMAYCKRKHFGCISIK